MNLNKDIVLRNDKVVPPVVKVMNYKLELMSVLKKLTIKQLKKRNYLEKLT